MASSDNLMSFETWAFRPSFETSWISESYARDNDALTKALHHSISAAGIPTAAVDAAAKPETPPSFQSGSSSGGVSETETVSKRGLPPKGKVAKRRSRASKRSPTTFINANPENFRQMVQQVTGVRFNPAAHVPAGSIIKPEPQKGGSTLGTMLNRLHGSHLLPTLDTSAFLLDHHHQAAATAAAQPVVVADGGGAGGFDFDGFSSCFPTLDSWKVM